MNDLCSDKTLAFLRAYAETPDRLKAYEAVFGSRDMSDYLAFVSRSEVRAGIMRVQSESIARAGVDRGWLLSRLVLLSEFNIRHFLVEDSGGDLVYDLTQATEGDWYCINELMIEPLRDGEGLVLPESRVRLKAVDKIQSLKMIKDMLDEDAPIEIKLTVDEYEVKRQELLEREAEDY